MEKWTRYKTANSVTVYELRNEANTRAAVVRNYGKEFKELTMYSRLEAFGEWTTLTANLYDTVKLAKEAGEKWVKGE